MNIRVRLKRTPGHVVLGFDQGLCFWHLVRVVFQSSHTSTLCVVIPTKTKSNSAPPPNTLSPTSIGRSNTARSQSWYVHVLYIKLIVFRLLVRTSVYQRARRAPRKRLSTLIHEKTGMSPSSTSLFSLLIIFCRYDVKAPGIFDVKQVGKTLVNRSTGLSMNLQKVSLV